MAHLAPSTPIHQLAPRPAVERDDRAAVRTDWQVAASYIGSHTDRLWNQVAINPGVFLGTGAGTLRRRVLPELDHRESEPAARVLVVEREPGGGAAHRQSRHPRRRRDAGLSRAEAVVSASRHDGVSLSGNYTLSRCFGDPSLPNGRIPQIANGYTNPDDPDRSIAACAIRIARTSASFSRRARRRRSLPAARCARSALGLARVGHLQRPVGAPDQRHLRARTARSPASRISASIRCLRRPVRRQDAWTTG